MSNDHTPQTMAMQQLQGTGQMSDHSELRKLQALVDDLADKVLDRDARIEALEAENNRLMERLGPHGMEVVFIGGTGHYVNVKIKAHIEALEEALRDVIILTESEEVGSAWDVIEVARAALASEQDK